MGKAVRPNKGRAGKEEKRRMVRVQLMLDPVDLEAAEEDARRRGTSLSEWVRQAMRERLEREAQSRRAGPELKKPWACVECVYWQAPKDDSDRPWWVGTCALDGSLRNDYDRACPQGELDPKMALPALEPPHGSQQASQQLKGYCFQCMHFKASNEDILSLTGRCTVKKAPVDGGAELCEAGALDPSIVGASTGV